MNQGEKILLVYLRNSRITPSSYYRVFQYLEELTLLSPVEIKIRDFYPNFYYKVFNVSNKVLSTIKAFFYVFGTIRRFFQILKDCLIRNSKIILIQKSTFPRYLSNKSLYKALLKSCGKVIWDFDDNIIDSGEISKKEWELLCEKSTTIIVCNEFLKNKIPLFAQNKVILLPTTDKLAENIDLEEINSKRLIEYESQINIIWIGTHSNLIYLKKILPEIEEAAGIISKAGKKAVLRVVSNKGIAFKSNVLKVENITWSREVAFNELMKAHVGLMPLEKNFYTPGKCGFKAVQYIGMGVPVILSPIGFNLEVVKNHLGGIFAKTSKEWVNAITMLSTNKEYWLLMSKEARERWYFNFNSEKIFNTLKNIVFD